VDTVFYLLMGPSIVVAVGLEPCQDDTHIFSRVSKNGGGYTPLPHSFLKSSILEKPTSTSYKMNTGNHVWWTFVRSLVKSEFPSLRYLGPRRVTLSGAPTL